MDNYETPLPKRKHRLLPLMSETVVYMLEQHHFLLLSALSFFPWDMDHLCMRLNYSNSAKCFLSEGDYLMIIMYCLKIH
jgi:hypothetical protein